MQNAENVLTMIIKCQCCGKEISESEMHIAYNFDCVCEECQEKLDIEYCNNQNGVYDKDE